MLSLLKLLKQKSVDKVTVKDICDECEINRNTFYSVSYTHLIYLYNDVRFIIIMLRCYNIWIFNI